MWLAASQDLKSAKGLKTLLVLTDGDDNRLEEHKLKLDRPDLKEKYNPNDLAVKDFILSGFKPLGITVNMVFFTPVGVKEEIELRRETLWPGTGPARTSRQLSEGQRP